MTREMMTSADVARAAAVSRTETQPIYIAGVCDLRRQAFTREDGRTLVYDQATCTYTWEVLS